MPNIKNNSLPNIQNARNRRHGTENIWRNNFQR